MSDLWMVGPTALALALRRLGFSPTEAERLVSLRMRYVRGGFYELTDDMKRLTFVRWLVHWGWLSEDIDDIRDWHERRFRQ